VPEHYDVIVIGSGAGGGTLTHALAPTGKKVLLLERGGWYPREKENWSSVSVWGDLRYRNAGRWVDHHGKEFNPKQHYYVGGNTKVYGAVLFRMRQRDFDNVHHVDGLSPEWPLKYDDFEPWYEKAEQLYHVHGERGIDPLDPPGRPYRYPAMSHEARIEELAHDLKGAGLKPFANRVEVERSGRIKLTYEPSNLVAHERLAAKLRGLLDAIQCKQQVIDRSTYLGGRLGISGVAHQNGTARFGTDPSTSPLDVTCRMHDVDNLYVVDSSFFCSSSAVNPTLTIIANALRVADHLTERLGA
jgi:choline dehydrogenase-like flavoprotein